MAQPGKTLIHVTHEAARKIGGIGAVLDGMLTAGAYREAVGRSILIAPLFTTEGGMKVMEDFMQRFSAGEIDIVRSDYSAMTMGALEAIKNAGRAELLGHIVGEGGHYLAIEAVIAGDFARETQTPPQFGEVAINSALKIINGEEVPARQQVPIKIFNSDDPDAAKTYLEDIRGKGLEF